MKMSMLYNLLCQKRSPYPLFSMHGPIQFTVSFSSAFVDSHFTLNYKIFNDLVVNNKCSGKVFT